MQEDHRLKSDVLVYVVKSEDIKISVCKVVYSLLTHDDHLILYHGNELFSVIMQNFWFK